MMNRRIFVTISYILLLAVMGGRTAIFVSNFDQLVPIGDISLLSGLLAIALMLAVPGAAWHRAQATNDPQTRRLATWTVAGAAGLDGWFNTAEAFLIASETGILQTASTPLMRMFLAATIAAIGIGPTLLTVALASLAGSLRAAQTATDRPAIVRSLVMDAHWSTIANELHTGDIITRATIEDWTAVGKSQAVSIIKYGRQLGLIEDVGRGRYMIIARPTWLPATTGDDD